jgi:hypothetical protein
LPFTYTCKPNEKYFLVGSEAQIKWSKTIRAERIKDIDDLKKRYSYGCLGGLFGATPEALAMSNWLTKKRIDALLNKVHTLFWIETRDCFTIDLLEDPDKSLNEILTANADEYGDNTDNFKL